MAAKSAEDVDRLFEEYINAGNAAAVLELYQQDAVLVSQEGELHGRAAIQPFVEQLVAAKLRVQMRITKVVRSGDTAVLYNDWSGFVTGPDGKSMPMSGKALEVVRRQADGTWLFVIDDPYARA
jgi:uncharacterized protein (TIGR02246 family)